MKKRIGIIIVAITLLIFPANVLAADTEQSTLSAKSYVNAWKITSKSSSKSGKTAIAKATAKQYYNGTVINTINETVKLTCSSTGKFS